MGALRRYEKENAQKETCRHYKSLLHRCHYLYRKKGQLNLFSCDFCHVATDKYLHLFLIYVKILKSFKNEVIMKKALFLVLSFFLVCSMASAKNAYYSFNAPTEKIAKAQFVSSYKDLHDKTGARLIMKHFSKKTIGYRVFVFVDVDENRLPAGWKKSLRFFRVAFLGVKVIAENENILKNYGPGQGIVDKASFVVETFYDADKLSNYIVRWNLFSNQFYLGAWAREMLKGTQHRGLLPGEVYLPVYTAALSVRGDGEREELFKETWKTRFYH